MTQYDIPALRGSEKQVVWANELRQAMIEEWERTKAGLEARGTSPASYMEAMNNAFYTDILARPEQCLASWWINSRGLASHGRRTQYEDFVQFELHKIGRMLSKNLEEK